MRNPTTNSVERAVGELKDSIKDISYEEKIYGDEFYLLRWLIAKKMVVKKAEESIRNCFLHVISKRIECGLFKSVIKKAVSFDSCKRFLRRLWSMTAKWRQENGVASLIEESFPEGWLETMPIYIDAVTPDGVLIVTIEAGLIDFLGMLNKFGRKKTVLLFMQAFSQIEQVLIDLNRKNLGDEPLTENSVIGAIILIDMDQFAVRQLRSIEGIQAITEICQNLVKYFPYVSSMFMFINCNIVTSALFKIVRPILESPSLKFEVYGQNKSEWQGRVSNFAPENLLRTPFGGTKPKENIIKRRKMVDRSQILSMNTIK